MATTAKTVTETMMVATSMLGSSRVSKLVLLPHLKKKLRKKLIGLHKRPRYLH